MNREERQEASIPAVARIAIVDLAALDALWLSKGYYVRSMSQLISWSIELLVEELGKQGMLPQTFEAVTEADEYLRRRGLYQRSMEKRGSRKISMAKGFENLRSEGGDPREYAPTQYKMMHPVHQVEPSPIVEEGNGVIVRNGVRWIEIPGHRGYCYVEGDEAMKEKLLKQIEMFEKRKQAEIDKALKAAKESGLVVDESIIHEGMTEKEATEHIRKLDEERVKAENDPATLDYLRENTVKEDIDNDE